MPARAAVWLRVSKDEQHPENQELVLRRWAEQLHLEVCKIYRLAGRSATKGEQDAEISRMLQDRHHGEFDVLLVMALDRIERRGAAALLNLVKRIDAAGIDLRSYNETWVTTAGPLRDMFLAFIGWYAQQETARISERSKAGLARRRAEGKPIGRQPGSKDKRPRRKVGYLLRQERERGS